MTAPPRTSAQSGITGTRPNAETKRVHTARLIRGYERVHGCKPTGAQVRHLLPVLMADTRLEDDHALYDWLMRQAPGGRKTHVARDNRLRLTPA